MTRPPKTEEADQLVKFYQRQKSRCERRELDAAKVAGPGDGDGSERAAWAALARLLFNFDEAIVKD